MSGFKQSITKGITTINVRTNNFVEQSKCKTYISTLEEEIRNLQFTIGEAIYNNWEEGVTSIEDVTRYLEEIHEKKQIIREQEERMKEIQLEEQQILGTNEANRETGNAAAVFCSQCGAKNQAGYKFCVKCGSEL